MKPFVCENKNFLFFGFNFLFIFFKTKSNSVNFQSPPPAINVRDPRPGRLMIMMGWNRATLENLTRRRSGVPDSARRARVRAGLPNVSAHAAPAQSSRAVVFLHTRGFTCMFG
jgi:hypothetical protein